MRLNLLPDKDGYSVKMSNGSTIENELKGGAVAKRLDMLDITYIANTQFTLNRAQFNYFRTFIDTYYSAPQWFDILLVIEPNIPEYPLRNYKAQILPGTVALNSQDGLQFVVSMQIECYLDDIGLTSKNYPVDQEDSVFVRAYLAEAAMKITNHIYDRYSNSTPAGDSLNGLDYIKVIANFIEGELKIPLVIYDKWPAESATVLASFIEGELRTILRLYDKWPNENITVSASFVEGEIKVLLIVYDKWPVESIGVTASFSEGTLT